MSDYSVVLLRREDVNWNSIIKVDPIKSYQRYNTKNTVLPIEVYCIVTQVKFPTLIWKLSSWTLSLHRMKKNSKIIDWRTFIFSSIISFLLIDQSFFERRLKSFSYFLLFFSFHFTTVGSSNLWNDSETLNLHLTFSCKSFSNFNHPK